MADTVQQIKDRLSITDVVGMYIKLERAGSSTRARCPFHAERTPSFHVSADRGTYHCFGCGVGGDMFSFIEAIEGIDFKGALKILAEKAGVPLVYSRGEKENADSRDRLFSILDQVTFFYSSRMTDAAKQYLIERGLKEETIKEFRLGWAGKEWSEASDFLKKKGFRDNELVEAGLAKKNERGNVTDKFRNRIMFPISDTAGRVVGFSGRIFGEDASPEAPKYLNSPETPLYHKSKILYGFDKAKLSMRKLNCAILVEGQMDLLMSHQAGWSNTLAVSGTAFTTEHAVLIKRMTDNLILALDPDEAGIKAAGRAARAALMGGLNVKVAQLPIKLDPADLIAKQGNDAWKEIIKNAKGIITFLLNVLDVHSKSPEAFRRTVELVVLPFLSDIQSPIAREQAVREVAQSIGASESSVFSALENVPTQQGAVNRDPQTTVSQASIGRARHAFGILLWQESLAKKAIDTKALEEGLIVALGSEAFWAMRGLPENEHEKMRFSVERLYGPNNSPKKDAESLIRILLLDRLSADLAEVTTSLRRAESRADSLAIGHYMDKSRLLTAEIAKLHKEG